MTLSRQTLEYIEEAESQIRAAIKSAAVNEKPLVVKQLAQLLLDMEQCKSLMKLWICWKIVKMVVAVSSDHFSLMIENCNTIPKKILST